MAHLKDSGTHSTVASEPASTVACWCGGSLQPSVHPLYGGCRACGTLVLAQRLSAEKLKDFYTADGYWRGHVVEKSGHPPIDVRAENDFHDRIPVWHSLVAKYHPRAKSLIEIGCSHGGFLHYCRERGIPDVVGVEVDQATCDFAKRRFNLEHVQSGLFPDVKLPFAQFDVVSSFDVLEHFLDPVHALRAVAGMLKDDGVFIFQTPCYRGENASWEQFRPEEHIFLFDARNIHQVMAQADLEVTEILPGYFRDDMFVVGRKRPALPFHKAAGRKMVLTEPEAVKRILVFRPDAIGDNVLAGAMLPHLKTRYPRACITVVCQEHVAPLYRACPHADDIISFDRLSALQNQSYRDNLLASLRALHADLALTSVYSPEPLTDLLTIGSGARMSVALRGDTCNMTRELHAQREARYDLLLDSPGEWRPELTRHADFLSGLGVKAGELSPEMWLSSEDNAFAEEFFRERGLAPKNVLLLFAGASHKMRIFQRYGESLVGVCREFNLTVIAVGVAVEYEFSQGILDALGAPGINLCGKLSLTQTAAVLKRCRAAIGAETGTAHMACALGVPQVVVLGGGHFGRFMPYSASTRAVVLPLDCYCCNWNCKFTTTHCVQDVAPVVIEQALRHALTVQSDRPVIFVQGTSLSRPGAAGPTWQTFDKWLATGAMEIIPVGAIPRVVAANWQVQQLRHEQRFDEAEAVLVEVGSLADSEVSMRINRAIDINREGERLFNAGDRVGAAATFAQAIELHPHCVAAQNNLAVLSLQVGDTARAIAHISAALEIDANNREVVFNATKILVAIGAVADALAISKAHLAAHPDDPELLALTSQLQDGAKPAERDGRYWVSAIVSTYNSERFLRGCLDDLEAQTIADQIEIIVVDSGSEQNERAIVEEYQRRYDNIRYVRTEQRETVYAAWNRGVQVAAGRYLTNANTDDRHRRDAFERMATELDARPDLALVYADCAVTQQENAGFGAAELIGHFNWPEFDPKRLFQVCYVGPQPMWRRDLHERYGHFDPEYRSAGDYEFWLRCVSTERFLHLREVLGQYLISQGSIENSDKALSGRESERARRAHWQSAWGERPAPSGSFFVPAEPREMCTSRPLVSVIIPTCNRESMLKDAMASLLAQDYQYWEAIVVNDGGVDVQDAVLAADKLGRIRYLSHDKSRGPGAARNTGLRQARGTLICYLDDDDLFLPNHLATVVAALEGKSSGFVYTDARYASEQIGEDGRKVVSMGTRYEHEKYSRDRLLTSNYIPINTWAHHKVCMEKSDLFDEYMVSHEDWELLLRLARHYEFEHIKSVTVEVREREDGARVTMRGKQGFVKDFCEIYRRTDDLADAEIRNQREQVLRGLSAQAASAERFDDVYQVWAGRQIINETGMQRYRERMQQWVKTPIVHIIIDLQEGQQDRLADTIDSLGGQLLENWRLSVIASQPAPNELFNEIDVLRWERVQEGDDRCAALNKVVAEVAADWVSLGTAGDRYAAQFSYAIAEYDNHHPQSQLIYSDDDRIAADGGHIDARFKPDFNLDLLRSMPYMGECCVLRRDLLIDLGGYAPSPAARNYDIALRVLDARGEAVIGHVTEVLYHRRAEDAGTPANEGRIEQCRQALIDHLQRNGIAAEVRHGQLPGSYFIDYRHAAQPLVSIIIPTHDQADLLRMCVTSLLEKTDYPNFEVLVIDNNTTQPAALELLDKLADDPRVRVLRHPDEYNFAAINNRAAREARGDYLLLLNNDTVVLTAHWLTRLMAHGQRPEVGIVGARLVYPDQRLQHAGIVLGMGGSGVAEHPFIGLPFTGAGYMGRAQVVQNYAGVTAACLLIRKSLYAAVSGMDERCFKVFYNDVDLCLKVGKQGFKIVWTPFATLIHHGSASLKTTAEDPAKIARARSEAFAMYERWLPALVNDPAYNRNLNLRSSDPRPDVDFIVPWQATDRALPRIAGFALGSEGSCLYRADSPLQALDKARRADCALIPRYEDRVCTPTVAELARIDPDIMLLHNTVHDSYLHMLELYKRFNRAFRVFGGDDLMFALHGKNPFQKTIYRDMKKRLRTCLSLCDRLVVTTEPLAEAYRGMIDDIRVVPNYLESTRWGHLQSLRRQGDKPRVGWAGATQHQGDLELLIDVVRETAKEVDWVFLGMCPEAIRPYICEFHKGVPLEVYPEKLASLNLDLAVAPLETHRFNEAKSNLRILEYGVLGWPVICTNIHPYQNAPVERVSNNPRAWINAIRARIHDLDATAAEGDRLRRWVLEHNMLEAHLDYWLTALSPGAPVSLVSPIDSVQTAARG